MAEEKESDAECTDKEKADMKHETNGVVVETDPILGEKNGNAVIETTVIAADEL